MGNPNLGYRPRAFNPLPCAGLRSPERQYLGGFEAAGFSDNRSILCVNLVKTQARFKVGKKYLTPPQSIFSTVYIYSNGRWFYSSGLRRDGLEERFFCYWSPSKVRKISESTSPARIPHGSCADYLDEEVLFFLVGDLARGSPPPEAQKYYSYRCSLISSQHLFTRF